MNALLYDFGEVSPSGDDLEYEQVFTDLVLAAQGKPEQQIGDQLIPAEEPDYRIVAERARAVLSQSHDLRAGAYLALAELRLNGLPAFAEVLDFMRAAIEDFWPTCHPQLDADDDDDPTMRVNTVAELANPDTILRALRLAPLTDSRTFGRLSWRNIQIANGDITPTEDDDAADTAAIAAAFQDTDVETVASNLKAVDDARAHVAAIVAKFDAETPDVGPNLDDLSGLLTQIRHRLAEAGGETEGVDTADVPVTADGDVAPAEGRAKQPTHAVNSQADVHQVLDNVIAYYKRSEPSSPVPILLERAKRLVGADFLEIVKDMAPGGVDNVQLVGGIEDDD